LFLPFFSGHDDQPGEFSRGSTVKNHSRKIPYDRFINENLSSPDEVRAHQKNLMESHTISRVRNVSSQKSHSSVPYRYDKEIRNGPGHQRPTRGSYSREDYLYLYASDSSHDVSRKAAHFHGLLSEVMQSTSRRSRGGPPGNPGSLFLPAWPPEVCDRWSGGYVFHHALSHMSACTRIHVSIFDLLKPGVEMTLWSSSWYTRRNDSLIAFYKKPFSVPELSFYCPGLGKDTPQ